MSSAKISKTFHMWKVWDKKPCLKRLNFRQTWWHYGMMERSLSSIPQILNGMMTWWHYGMMTWWSVSLCRRRRATRGSHTTTAARIGKAAEEEMKDDDRRAGKQHEPATGRQQQKMAEDFCPRHTNISLSAPGSYSKTISTSMLSGAKRIALSTTFSNTFCSLSRSPRRSFTMLPGRCSTHPAFSGTSRLA